MNGINYFPLELSHYYVTRFIRKLSLHKMADRGEPGVGPRRRRGPARERVPQPQARGFIVNVHNTIGGACSLKKVLAIVGVGLLLFSFVLVNSVKFQVNSLLCPWVGWSPFVQCWVQDEDVHSFRHLFDMMTNDDFGQIEDLPAIIDAVRHNIDTKLDTFLTSGMAEGRWQENVVDRAFGVLRLYREAKESVFDFVLRGRSLMRDMVNQNIDDIQTAFDQGKYEIIHMRLGDVRDHLKEASKALETAKVKLKNAMSTTDDLLSLITSKLVEKVSSAEEVKQGWSAGYTTTLYTLGVAFGAAVTVFAPVPLAVGAVPGAGLTGFYQFLKAGARYNLRQRLHSEAKELSSAGGKVRNASDILEQCVLGVTELESAVEGAQLSTERMAGYLRPADAEIFTIPFRDAKHNYQNLLVLYERTVENIQSGSMKSKRLT